METQSPRLAGANARGGVRAAPTRPTARHGRIVRRLALAAALLVMPGAALGAVTIKGKAEKLDKLLNPVWNEAKETKSNRWTFREPSPTVRADVRALTAYVRKEVCIAALGEKGAPLKVPLRVVIAGGRTTPVTLVVAEGQQIQFENQDPFPHKIYDVGNKGLQPTETPAAKSRTWTPPGPGKYEIRDQLAPSIRSWIVVEPQTVAVGYPDRKGDYAIDLEPGKYTLRGYFAGDPVGTPLEVNVTSAPEQIVKGSLVLAEGGDKKEPEKK